MSSSELPRGVIGFVVLYSWKLHPTKEAQFQEAWNQLTEVLHVQYGVLGSRLHRADNGTWVAYNQWPDRDTWERSRASPPQEQVVFARLREAIAMEFPPLLMETVAEFLGPCVRAGCQRCDSAREGAAGARESHPD